MENTDVYTHNSSKLQLWSGNENNSMVGGQHEGLSIREAENHCFKARQEFKSSEKENGAELGKDWVFEDLSNSK